MQGYDRNKSANFYRIKGLCRILHNYIYTNLLRTFLLTLTSLSLSQLKPASSFTFLPPPPPPSCLYCEVCGCRCCCLRRRRCCCCSQLIFFFFSSSFKLIFNLFCQAHRYGVFNRITCSQYSNMFTHTFILHAVKKKYKKKYTCTD